MLGGMEAVRVCGDRWVLGWVDERGDRGTAWRGRHVWAARRSSGAPVDHLPCDIEEEVGGGGGSCGQTTGKE